ncbi:MAG: GDYXXLXY domain-containing protein [bacterium]|nr:GDYXXLXY domain-containing protein [bacterium]
MQKVRTIVFIGVSLVLLSLLNLLILQKEQILEKGRTLLLELAPKDPRSLMQGDYMVLRYKIARDADSAVSNDAPTGRLVIKTGKNDMAQFVRIYKGEALQPGESLLKYRYRGMLRLGAESFFFQEGHAPLYNNAKYGELRVTDSGESVLVGLRDKDFKRLDSKDSKD